MKDNQTLGTSYKGLSVVTFEGNLDDVRLSTMIGRWISNSMSVYVFIIQKGLRFHYVPILYRRCLSQCD